MRIYNRKHKTPSKYKAFELSGQQPVGRCAYLVVQVDNVSESEVRVSGNESTFRPLEDKGHDSQVVGTGNARVDIGLVIADMHKIKEI